MPHDLRPSLLSPRRLLSTGLGGLVALAAAPAIAAGYATPPESPYQQQLVEPDPREPERPYAAFERAPSTFRFHVGPALLVQPGSPGLATALDIGRRAVGARLSGSWLRAGSERGLSVYSAELWVDLRPRTELHPILGAGASWLHGGAVRSESEGSSRSAGAGVLRAALEYELPLADADARLGLNVLALVPAIDSDRSRPWLVTTLMIGAGF